MDTLCIKVCTFIAISIASIGFILPQPAKADLWCWAWERNCVQDGRVGTSGNNLLGGGRDGFNIEVVNRTGTQINVQVEVYVKEPSKSNCSRIIMMGAPDPCSGYEGWRTKGTWTFVPGEKGIIITGGKDYVVGRNASFKAFSSDGRVWEKQVDMGSTIGDFTFTFL